MASERALRIIGHYRTLGLDKGWRADRYHRLCRMVGCAPDELAALCCVTEKRMNIWLKDNSIPPYVALTLACIETAWLTAYDGVRRDPVMPNL